MATSSQYPIKKVTVTPPSLEELASSIASGLPSNFVDASCTVETPPDLTQQPYNLAGPGLTGNARVVDIGGPPYLLPSPDASKKFDLLTISRQTDMTPSTGLIIGAGAGPMDIVGAAEWIPNFAYGTAAGTHESGLMAIRNRNRYAKVNGSDRLYCCPLQHSGFSLMSNLFCSDGVRGPCLHIKARSRTGSLNFPAAIQAALGKTFGDKFISLGGVFLVRKGTVYLHIAPDYPAEPFGTFASVDKWLRYFDVPSGENEGTPLACLSVLHSGDDGDLDVRPEHTHCFTADRVEEGETRKGGHYHYDIEETKDVVEYEGWFNVAETVYRIDKPAV
ncbi:unnamed protein product [Clonostachys byssicola]|uniref:DUF1907 domain-containing protein n=1 Tax=Clonostachys byssicola TaxID=160290 RepID=A0A9N9UL76_9HYPO|nr:unnamed protein product [Clonostachys byssicola]